MEKRVLDVACGRGYGAYILAHVAREVTGIDLNEKSLAFAAENFRRDNLRFLAQDVTALSGSANHDLVTAFEVIEHIPGAETDAFLAGLKARLAPGGTLLLSTPNHDVVVKSGMPVPAFHINNFRPVDLHAALARHFGEVELLGQYRARSFLNQILFSIDRWNLRHLLARAFRRRGGEGAKGNAAGQDSEAEKLMRARPALERFPEEAEKYCFSPDHWRQAGLTIAICRNFAS